MPKAPPPDELKHRLISEGRAWIWAFFRSSLCDNGIHSALKYTKFTQKRQREELRVESRAPDLWTHDPSTLSRYCFYRQAWGSWWAQAPCCIVGSSVTLLAQSCKAASVIVRLWYALMWNINSGHEVGNLGRVETQNSFSRADRLWVRRGQVLK